MNQQKKVYYDEMTLTTELYDSMSVRVYVLRRVHGNVHNFMNDVNWLIL